MKVQTIVVFVSVLVSAAGLEASKKYSSSMTDLRREGHQVEEDLQYWERELIRSGEGPSNSPSGEASHFPSSSPFILSSAPTIDTSVVFAATFTVGGSMGLEGVNCEDIGSTDVIANTIKEKTDSDNVIIRDVNCKTKVSNKLLESAEVLFELLKIILCDRNDCESALLKVNTAAEKMRKDLKESMENGSFTKTLKEKAVEAGDNSFANVVVDPMSLTTEIEDIVTNKTTTEPSTEPSTEPTTKATTEPATFWEIITTFFWSLLAALVEALTFIFTPSF